MRLAERTGLLTGPDISPVQFRSAVALQYLEELDHAHREKFELKLGLLATGEFDYSKMFPEYFVPTNISEEEEDAAEAAGENVSYDYKGVKWLSPEDAKDEYAGLLDQMLKQGGKGSITGDQVVTEPTRTEWV
jgi:hypothetical protein